MSDDVPTPTPAEPFPATAAHHAPPGFALLEPAVPARGDEAADLWAYRGIADVEREIAMSVWGYDDLVDEPRAVLTEMWSQHYATKRRFVVVRGEAGRGTDEADHRSPSPATNPTGRPARSPEDVVGHVFVSLPTTSNTHLGEAYVSVRPAYRGQGIGTSLADLAERLCRAAGRTVVLSATEQSSEPRPGPEAIEPGTGAGRVWADAAGVRFATSRGYALEQVDRHSVLELPRTSALRDRGAAARAVAGSDYRTHTWTDEAPSAWVDQVAVLLTRMSTDVPLGGIDVHEDPWDAERVRVWEGEARDRGHGMLTTAVEHAPTGTLAGFTVFTYSLDRPEFVFQDDTIVLRGHRGHRLGMLVKVVNLDALATVRPGTRRVHTWNAEENDHMLAINVALGFAPAGGWATWQRVEANG